MSIRILTGDCRDVLRTLPDESVHCCVTSPPYFGLRDYGVAGQIGLEPTPDAFVAEMVAVFREVRRVLRGDGTLWLNLGDSYVSVGTGTQGAQGEMATRRVAQVRDRKSVHSSVQLPPSVPGLASKNLIGIPWRVAFALQADGWWLRSDIIWAKPNPMPESVTDRPTSAHEHVFLLAKSERYYFDAEAVKERAVQPIGVPKLTGQHKANAGGFTTNGTGNSSLGSNQGADNRNIRNVWTIATQPYSDAHFATFPPALIEPCIKAGTSEKGVCPHCGAGWVRQIERTQPPDYGRGTTPKNQGQIGQQQRNALGPPGNGLGVQPSITTGWQPSCSCPEHQPIPATVLDPFFGAGTTGLVADRLGRNCIGVEINSEYAAMARRRIERDAGMFADMGIAV